MAGHNVDRPARVEQWRQRHRHRLARAESPVEQIAVAVDHLRLALKCSSPQQRKRTAKQVCSHLITTADGLLNTYEKGRSPKQ